MLKKGFQNQRLGQAESLRYTFEGTRRVAEQRMQPELAVVEAKLRRSTRIQRLAIHISTRMDPITGSTILIHDEAGHEMKHTDRIPWVGLVEVKEEPGSDALGGAEGAFVNVLSLARCEDDYRESVREWLGRYGLRLVEARDIESLASRKMRDGIAVEIENLERSLSDKWPVQFDEFQSYDHGDEG